jgi:predicted GNAT superfamily acetyltransferase
MLNKETIIGMHFADADNLVHQYGFYLIISRIGNENFLLTFDEDDKRIDVSLDKDEQIISFDYHY